jgi:hypothetical protein
MDAYQGFSSRTCAIPWKQVLLRNTCRELDPRASPNSHAFSYLHSCDTYVGEVNMEKKAEQEDASGL